jgi:hypothetical protein
MAKIRTTESLGRYSDLPALLYVLKHRQITLLDRATWDDTNDSYYLLKYKEKKHLKIFSHGSAGVCINFHRAKLTQALRSQPGVTVRDVKYRKVREARKRIEPPKLDDLPFLKRLAFVAEEEVRAVYESSDKALRFLDIPIDLSMILRITLSPWIHDRIKAATKDAIYAIPGCKNLDIRRSTLIGNAEWKELGDDAANPSLETLGDRTCPCEDRQVTFRSNCQKLPQNF